MLKEMSESIVVFGSSGFIGSHLLEKLVSSGKKHLIGVDIRDPLVAIPSVQYINGDVRDLSRFDIDGPVKTIYNLAAIHTTPGHETYEYYETNVLGASEVTSFARRKDVHEIVFTSSISVYGPGEETKSEASEVKPSSAYGCSKLLAERIHCSWRGENNDRRLIICRPAVVFGPREGGNFTRLSYLMRKGIFVYPGRKDAIKACFYIDDLLDAIFFAERQRDSFILFNGCYPDRYTLEDIITTFKKNHFPFVRTITLPRYFVTFAAWLLGTFSVFGIGLHPERVTKLIRSTDVIPGWLIKKGWSKPNLLQDALDRWKSATLGRFD